MSDKKLAEIRARHEEGVRAGADEDRAYLLAEVERLRAENERLRAALEYMVNVCPAIDPDGDRAHERARKALEAKP